MQIRRDVATAAAAIRIGGQNSSMNRKDHLTNQSRLSSGVPSDVIKMNSQSLEPGFRVYGKNHAAKEFNDMVKVK